MSKCPECGGKHFVELLTSTIPCPSCMEVSIHDEYVPKSVGLSFVEETSFDPGPLSKADFYKQLYGGTIGVKGRAPSELQRQDPTTNVREVFEAAATSKRIVEARINIDLDVEPGRITNTRTTTITIVEEIG